MNPLPPVRDDEHLIELCRAFCLIATFQGDILSIRDNILPQTFRNDVSDAIMPHLEYIKNRIVTNRAQSADALVAKALCVAAFAPEMAKESSHHCFTETLVASLLRDARHLDARSKRA